MPEGDTVFHTAETLRQALVGRTLTRCDVRVPRFAAADLTGLSTMKMTLKRKRPDGSRRCFFAPPPST